MNLDELAKILPVVKTPAFDPKLSDFELGKR